MKRREFIGLVASVVAWPLVARSQNSIPVIGFLSSRSPGESEALVAMFRAGLGETGYVIGKNATIEFRWADGQYGRLPELAADLVAKKVSVLLAAGGPPSALAAKAATSTIPIVFSGTSDAVGIGLVSSLSHPGGNVTGMSLFNLALGAKRLELLKEVTPASNVFAYLVNPANPSARLELQEAEKVAGTLGVQMKILNASTEPEVKAAFEGLAQLGAGGVIVAGEPFFDSRREMIVALAERYAIPATYGWRENVVLGGLMSYGTSLTDSYRQAGKYVGRILNGEKPADLPVVQPTKFELAINLKTAKKLGLNVSPSLIARADEIIE